MAHRQCSGRRSSSQDGHKSPEGRPRRPRTLGRCRCPAAQCPAAGSAGSSWDEWKCPVSIHLGWAGILLPAPALSDRSGSPLMAHTKSCLTRSIAPRRVQYLLQPHYAGVSSMLINNCLLHCQGHLLVAQDALPTQTGMSVQASRSTSMATLSSAATGATSGTPASSLRALEPEGTSRTGTQPFWR